MTAVQVELSAEDDLTLVVQQRMSATLDAVRELAKTKPSREASLAVTNLEQSSMWLDRALLPSRPVCEPSEAAAGEECAGTPETPDTADAANAEEEAGD